MQPPCSSVIILWLTESSKIPNEQIWRKIIITYSLAKSMENDSIVEYLCKQNVLKEVVAVSINVENKIKTNGRV